MVMAVTIPIATKKTRTYSPMTAWALLVLKYLNIEVPFANGEFIKSNPSPRSSFHSSLVQGDSPPFFYNEATMVNQKQWLTRESPQVSHCFKTAIHYPG